MKDTLVQTNVRLLRKKQLNRLNKEAAWYKKNAEAGQDKSGWRDELIRRAIDAYPLDNHQQ